MRHDMERYYIMPKDGGTNIIYEGNYSEALEFAATFLEIPDGETVIDYADVLTEEEYGDDESDE